MTASNPEEPRVVYVRKPPEELAAKKRRELVAVWLMTMGALLLAGGVAALVENIWAGAAIIGAVVLVVGVLLGRDT